MTCIIGLTWEGSVFMGGDSLASSSWDSRITLQHKVFQRNALLIGFTTSFRMGEIIQYEMSTIEPPGMEQGDLDYLHKSVLAAMRQALKDGGFTKIENNREEAGQFLLGYHGGLYEIASDWQIRSYAEPFSAIGGGYAYALGALSTMRIRNPAQAILKALRVAEHYSNGVGRPFYIYQQQDGVVTRVI